MGTIDREFGTLPWCRRYLDRIGESGYLLGVGCLNLLGSSGSDLTLIDMQLSSSTCSCASLSRRASSATTPRSWTTKGKSLPLGSWLHRSGRSLKLTTPPHPFARFRRQVADCSAGSSFFHSGNGRGKR